MSFSETLTGRFLHYENPRTEEICLEDIATGLSNICRYSGQIPKFYSVAEHCVLGLPYLPNMDLVQKVWLMHDASEAYMSDLPSPLKRIIPAYKKIEGNLDRVISEKYKISHNEHVHAIIKTHDISMLITEARLMHKNVGAWGFDSYPFIDNLQLQFWPPEIAKEKFITIFKELFGDGYTY